MTNRIQNTLGGGVPQYPKPPAPGGSAPGPLPWSAAPPAQNPTEQWNWNRRCDLTQLAVPFTIALLRTTPAEHAGASDWTPEGPDQDAQDRATCERAARLALFLQDALDRARPRT